MLSPASLFLHLLLLSLAIVAGTSQKFSRDDFPLDFVFGAGTSAYQVEGAISEDGKAPSLWDIYTHKGIVADNSNGDIAADGYHKYKEDVKLMSEIGLEGYRFSISWSRLLPKGRGAVNPKGLEFYNNLIDELISKGIQPHVTLYHLDLPLILEEEYKGWLSPKIIEDFTAYADVCFREFGDRVSHWTTLNEPNIASIASYDSGIWPPQRCSINCKAGNSSIEEYIAAHHSILAHASAVKLYRERYQKKQGGRIGVNVYSFWYSPMSNSSVDIKATKRALDFFTGWIIEPLVFGDYPENMKKIVGSRLPSFTKCESELIKGSFDFIGINYYIKIYIVDSPSQKWDAAWDFNSDLGVKISTSRDGTPSDPSAPPSSVPNDPSGLQALLEHFKNYYGNPPVYIHENGHGSPYNETLNDTARIDHLNSHFQHVLNAIRNGANTRGYFVWSFLDVFEFLTGYRTRYGIVNVDFEDKGLKRQPKLSAKWYSNFLKGKGKKKLNMKVKNREGDGSYFSSL